MSNQFTCLVHGVICCGWTQGFYVTANQQEGTGSLTQEKKRSGTTQLFVVWPFEEGCSALLSYDCAKGVGIDCDSGSLQAVVKEVKLIDLDDSFPVACPEKVQSCLWRFVPVQNNPHPPVVGSLFQRGCFRCFDGPWPIFFSPRDTMTNILKNWKNWPLVNLRIWLALFGGATQDAPGDARHSTTDTSADVELQLEARRTLIERLYQFELMLETCVKFARPVLLLGPQHPSTSSDPIKSKPDPMPLSPNPAYQGPCATAASATPTAVAGDIEMMQLLPGQVPQDTSTVSAAPEYFTTSRSHVEEEKKQADCEPTKSSFVGIPVLPSSPIRPDEGVVHSSFEFFCRSTFPLANSKVLSDIVCAGLQPSSLTDDKLNNLRQMLGLQKPAEETVATEMVLYTQLCLMYT